MLTLVSAAMHQVYATLVAMCDVRSSDEHGDRGAISLEQVLWFVAVAVSVGVIASILWNRIFDAADGAELDLPTPPGG